MRGAARRTRGERPPALCENREGASPVRAGRGAAAAATGGGGSRESAQQRRWRSPPHETAPLAAHGWPDSKYRPPRRQQQLEASGASQAAPLARAPSPAVAVAAPARTKHACYHLRERATAESRSDCQCRRSPLVYLLSLLSPSRFARVPLLLTSRALPRRIERRTPPLFPQCSLILSFSYNLS